MVQSSTAASAGQRVESSSPLRPAGVSERRTPVLRLLMFALAVRLLSAVLAFLANSVLPLDQRQQFTVHGRTHVFWDTFARYDSGWYWGIARDGYRFVEGGRNTLRSSPCTHWRSA